MRKRGLLKRVSSEEGHTKLFYFIFYNLGYILNFPLLAVMTSFFLLFFWSFFFLVTRRSGYRDGDEIFNVGELWIFSAISTDSQ